MKDDEKDKETGKEPSGEPTDEPKQMDRGKFLKALGVGIGAVGLGMATGSHLAARAATEPYSTRSGIQKLMRSLLEDPSRAEDFLSNPQAVAEEFGVRLTADDANKIKEVFTRLALKAGGAGATGHSDCHTDSGHTDCKSSDAASGTRRGIKQKPPTEGVAPTQPTEGAAPKQPTGGGKRR